MKRLAAVLYVVLAVTGCRTCLQHELARSREAETVREQREHDVAVARCEETGRSHADCLAAEVSHR